MLKQTARFAALALFMFAASANPLTANAAQPVRWPIPLSACPARPQLRAFSVAVPTDLSEVTGVT